MKRKPWMWAIFGTVLALTAGWYAYLSTNSALIGLAQGPEISPTPVSQAVARRGDLTVSISGSGQLIPVSSSNLSFEETGTLLEMNVQAGDRVQTGDLLARLKIDQTPAEHQAELASAELAVVQARQALDQLYANVELEAAQALVALENSQAALDDLIHPEMELAQAMQAGAKAQEAIAAAQLNLYILQSMPSQEAIDIANASLLFKQKEHQELQKAVGRLENQIKSAPNETIRDRLEAQLIRTQITLAQQKIEVDQASYKLATMADPPDPTSLSLAEVQLSTSLAELARAQQNLETAKGRPSPADLAQAELKAAEAQSAWEVLRNGPYPEALEKANIMLADAQAKLALVQQNDLILDLRAPFNGTILSVSALPGERVSNAAIVTLADLSQPLLEVSLDETDLLNIQTGLEAQVVFEALPDQIFAGRVAQIDPSLQRFENSFSVLAQVRLEQQENQPTLDLPLGLNASVDILVGEARNAVLVPVEALHQLESGDSVVFVITGGQIEQRSVTVGLMDFTTAEITSGLQAGEVVATGSLALSEGYQ
jgi:HlyD family secretion protein